VPDEPNVARVLVKKVRVERTRRFGDCYLGLELWRRLQLDEFLAQHMDGDDADVPWSRVAAVLAINRLSDPGSELAVEQHWSPSTALEDLLHIEKRKINDTRLYRCLDRLLPLKTKIEQHLKQRYGELFQAEFDVLLYDLTSTYVEGMAEANPMMKRGYSRDHRPDCEQLVLALIVNSEGFPFSYELFDGNRADVATLRTILRCGAQARESATGLDLRSWRSQRREPGDGSRARRTVSCGYAAELEKRVKAHVLVAFLGYALLVTLKHLLKRTDSEYSPAKALKRLSELHSVDIVLPTVDGREIWLRRVSKLDEDQQKIFHQLQLQLPERLDPIQIKKCSAGWKIFAVPVPDSPLEEPAVPRDSRGVAVPGSSAPCVFFSTVGSPPDPVLRIGLPCAESARLADKVGGQSPRWLACVPGEAANGDTLSRRRFLYA
jgi:hypothetical protein